MKLSLNENSFIFDKEIVALLMEIEEFKGSWKAYGNLAPERLTELKRIATIESVGSSTRIEGGKLSNAEVSQIMTGLSSRSFKSRDEQEVAGPLSISEMETILHVNKFTLRDHFKKLTLDGHLLKVGSGRSTKYTLKGF